jgi:hypothetical protein
VSALGGSLIKRRDLATSVNSDRTESSTSRKLYSGFKAFDCPYLLVEELSETARPIYQKTYPPNEDGTPTLYPRIHYTTKVPFQLADSSEKEVEADEADDVKVVRMVEEVPGGKIYSTASGLLLSGSRTTLVRAQSSSKGVDVLTKKLFVAKQSHQATAPSSAPKLLVNNESAFFSKAGYCENCNVKYEDFYSVSLSSVSF